MVPTPASTLATRINELAPWPRGNRRQPRAGSASKVMLSPSGVDLDRTTVEFPKCSQKRVLDLWEPIELLPQVIDSHKITIGRRDQETVTTRFPFLHAERHFVTIAVMGLQTNAAHQRVER
jgi:hypothetical protein